MKIGLLIKMYLDYRHSLGFKYKTNEVILRSFSRLVGEDSDIICVTNEICENFLYGGNKNRITKFWKSKYSALKGFYEWAMARNYTLSTPFPSSKPKFEECRSPYIYSNDELRRIFKQALQYRKRARVLPNRCMQMIVMLLYMLGLRTQEALLIRLSDIDLKNKVVCIRNTKFYKSRLVPFNDQIAQILDDFLKWRIESGMSQDTESMLFLGYDGKPVKIQTVRDRWDDIRVLAKVKMEGKWQPRLHDLRHTFAVNRLVRWYQEGKDVQRLLPLLSTYLGHTKISSTSIYLSMTNSLLKEANSIFHNYALGGGNTNE